jgi:hypothetical protein
LALAAAADGACFSTSSPLDKTGAPRWEVVGTSSSPQPARVNATTTVIVRRVIGYFFFLR